MEYISRYEYSLIINDIKKFDLDYFVYLFVLVDMQEDARILEKLNFDLYFIKETNRLIIKNISNFDVLLDRKKLINNLGIILKKNKNISTINNRQWYLFISSYFNMFYKAIIMYYIKNKLISPPYSCNYMLKLWLYVVNCLYIQISKLNEIKFN
jgi:hypothetical protein